MTDPRHMLGRSAEDAVAGWLEGERWTVLARRYRSSGGGEVDLVALDSRGTLVGIEVRARSTQRAGTAEESVDARRALRIGRSLAAFAAASRVPHRELRVDLVTAVPVLTRDGMRFRLRRTPSITDGGAVSRRTGGRVP
jgi:putative endonuclease